MPFPLHTEKLNLITAVASERDDEIYDAKQFAKIRDKTPPQVLPVSGSDSGSTVIPTTTMLSSPKDVTQLFSATRIHDIIALLKLGIPIMIIQFGSVIPAFVIASYLGRSTTTTDPADAKNTAVLYLDGYTLASLTANLFTLSLLTGLYTASDTLAPQAYGAGNMKEVGYIAIRGYIASLLVVLPIVIILMIYMKAILLYVGEEEQSVIYAYEWFSIYIYAIPFYALYQVTMKYLSAQNLMLPLIICCILSTCIVLPIAIYVCGNIYGNFIGSAVAMVTYQSFQAISLILYIAFILYPDTSANDIQQTWPGLYDGILHAVEWKPFINYMILGAGGMLASSEWIYWETLSLMIGTFGIIPLSVHTIPTQIITFQFMGPYSLGIALSIRLGATLPANVKRSKQIVIDTFIISIVTFGAISVIMYIYQDWFISIFTTTNDVIIGCHGIWDKVCIYAFCLSVYGIFMGVCVGLGMQWTLGIGTFITLWIVGLPSAYYFSVVKDGGIVMAWSTVWPPYVLLPIALGIAVTNVDWHTIANDIRIREGLELVEERRPSFIKINGVITANNVHNTNHAHHQQQALLLNSAYDESNKVYGSI